jgi:hypothetical protein
MEDLALLVSIILMYTFVFGVVGIFVIWKTPKSQLVRMAMIVLFLPAIYIAAQLMFNIDRLTGRLLFGAITAVIVVAIIALIKKPAIK